MLRRPLEVAIARRLDRADRPMCDPDVVRQPWEAFADLGQLERHVVVVGRHPT